MLLKSDFMFAKLQDELHPVLLPRVVTINWARRAERTILELLDEELGAVM